MRVVGIIPQRINSSRLNKKPFTPINKRTLHERFIERAMRIGNLDDVVVACPSTDYNELKPITRCHLIGAPLDENDVLGRLHGVADMGEADWIVRLNPDNACLDPKAVDYLITKTIGEGMWNLLSTNLGDLSKSAEQFGLGSADYTDTWPQGFGAEMYSYALLDWLRDNVTVPEEREHPHLLAHRTKQVYVPDCYLDWEPPMRVAVDTPEDVEKIDKIYKHFGERYFDAQEAIDFLSKGK